MVNSFKKMKIVLSFVFHEFSAKMANTIENDIISTSIKLKDLLVKFFRNYHNTKLSHFVNSIFSSLVHKC